MSDPGDTASPRHDPFAALRQPNFALFAGGRFAGTVAMTLFNAAIAWQVFDISGSALQLGFIGLARFAPSLGLSLVGGAVADSHDRRRILILAQLVPLACSAALFAATTTGHAGLPLIYTLVLLVAVAQAFENPARQALVPLLVTRESFPNAIVISSMVQSFGFVTGPAVGGLLIGFNGLGGAYAVHIALVAVSLGSLVFLRAMPAEGVRRAVNVESIKEGIRFVWARQPLLGAMTLDMFAVVFGGATALLPIYAKEILEVGPRGYGFLSASLEAGAAVTALSLVFLPPIKQTGRALLTTVALFGLGTIVFGLSRSFPLSLATYAFIGMADQVSVVLRQTTIQLSTPDELRGRVSSVSMLFVGASNQLGAMESGFVAALSTATFAVISGGVGCLAVVGAVASRMPELRRYRASPFPAHTPASSTPSTPLHEEELAVGG